MFVTKYVVLLNLTAVIHCTMEGFIVGGKRAVISDFPHSAYLHVICDENGIKDLSWKCAGSIINQDLLLTAAHCMDGCPGDMKMIISAGNVERLRGHRTSAKSYVKHESYSKLSGVNDIGLVKMVNRLQFSSRVSRVAIMRSPPETEAGYVAAWGLIDEDEVIETNYLMRLKQVFWKRADCIKVYGNIHRNVFCASSNVDNKYISSGDSGAALVIKNYIQVGIVSYKLPRKSRNLIVYTNVTSYYEWIHINSRKLYCKI